MVAGDFQQHHAVQPERIRLVYNGVDTARFSPDHRDSFRAQMRAELGITDEVLLLIIAHNFRLKGVPTLVRATAQLAREGHRVRLAVVGGKGNTKWSRRGNHPRSGEVVHFIGPVNDPVPYYAAADIYVHPTYYDPCSLVVLEALASGLPVVTSRYNGAGELITPGREGTIVADPGDAALLVHCLRPLMNADRRGQMGAAARSLSTAHSLEQNCRQIVDVYRQVDRGSRKAA
jgi:UDP-glucose:(heptosyl)LPS alpha-1,3-glucosyltransferase